MTRAAAHNRPDDRGRSSGGRQLALLPRERRRPTSPSPATRAITAGRRSPGVEPRRRRCGRTSTWQTDGLDDTRKRATGMPRRRLLQPLRQSDRARLRGGDRRARGRRGRPRLRVRAWAPSHRSCSALCSSRRPHRRPAPDLRRHDRVRARSVRPPRHRRHTGSTAPNPARSPRPCVPGRTMLVIAESPSNPRLDLVDLDELGAISGPFTRRRLDVRHADRPAAARATASTSCCTRRRRGSAATTTPRSA